MEESIFADEPEEVAQESQSDAYWHILLVDDEKGVHQVTEMVLRDFQFDGRALKVSNAYSAKEAREIIDKEDDIALAIIDVVMETDDAGLELVRYIRSELQNHYTRLVLRTGQPGQAPEEEVILEYDIDDYKDKTELTSNKLLTLLYAALRSYRDICVLDQHRRSLEQVILASTEIFEASSLSVFASAVLRQICTLLHLNGAIFYCTSLNDDLEESENFTVLAASGDMEAFQTKHRDDLPSPVKSAFEKALREKSSFIEEDSYTGYFSTSYGGENLLYVSIDSELSDVDRQLLDIYASNVAVTYENLLLKDEVLGSQKELAYILGEAVEQRSKETGSHVKRVALFSHVFALKYGLSTQEADLIKLASPLHDVGKIGIPDRILKKPGKFEPEEWEIMKTHAQLGADMLPNINNQVLKMGSIIAAQHHEHWQGGGYPKDLKGEEIHIAGRITAIADVFDALGCKRCYKEPWPMEEILNEINKQKGKQFDPKLVEILHENLNDFLAIRDAFPE
jgi:response regulator RpfG family c-di-GMP phosphodiesterase